MKVRNIFKVVLPVLLALSLSAVGGCTESFETPEKPVEPGGGDNGNNTGDEYDYISISYRKKSSGSFEAWSEAESSQTRVISRMNWFTPVQQANTNAWGSRTDKTGATDIIGKPGFFRVGKIGTRWYFIDPDGYPNIIRGTQHVKPYDTDDNQCPEKQQAFASKFGSDARWAEETASVLSANGLNYISYGHKRIEPFPSSVKSALLRPGTKKTAYAETLYLVRTFMWDMYADLGYTFEDGTYNRLVLIFEPTFLSYIDNLVSEKCADFVNDEHFIGYYLDNELNFNAYNNNSAVLGIELSQFLTLPDKYYGAREYAENFLAGRGKTASEITAQDRDDFREAVADYYFKVTTETVRRHDPNHLILGVRLHDWSKYNERTVKACAKYCDVVSLNYYGRWQPEPDYLRNLKLWSDKPFIVTEFYTKAADANYQGYVFENLEGGGWMVRTQKDRGRFYQNFCLGLIEAGNCIGWHHFQYNDSYGSAATNSNKGIFSIEYEPYNDFLGFVKELNTNVYALADYFDQ